MRIAIVGVDGTKMSDRHKSEIRKTIALLLLLKSSTLYHTEVRLVSGRSPKGGVDVMAEEIAVGLGLQTIIFPPDMDHIHWNCGVGCRGYRYRNLQIAKNSDALYCLTIADQTAYCKHCDERGHRDNGGCWTLKQARAIGVKETRRVDIQ